MPIMKLCMHILISTCTQSVCLNSQVQAVFHFKLIFYKVIYSKMSDVAPGPNLAIGLNC